jgi:hypothetical protein
MTTNPGAGTPAKQPAGAAEASGSELSPQATANTDTPETSTLTGHIAPPDDLRRLEAEIERTRERLGETVQELVTRADVKSLARAKAAELKERVKDTTSQARKTATTSAVGVRGQVADKTAAALQKATSAGATQTEQLRNRAVAVSAPAWQATPEQVRRAVTNGASGAKEGWIPLTLAASSLILGYLGVRRWRRFRLLRAPPILGGTLVTVDVYQPGSGGRRAYGVTASGPCTCPGSTCATERARLRAEAVSRASHGHARTCGTRCGSFPQPGSRAGPVVVAAPPCVVQGVEQGPQLVHLPVSGRGGAGAREVAARPGVRARCSWLRW